MSKSNDIRTGPRAQIRQRFTAANGGRDGFNFATLERGPPLEGTHVLTNLPAEKGRKWLVHLIIT